ncbi:GrpB family protein [soil metagenome]
MNSPAAFYPQTLLTEDRRYRPPIADKPITVVPYDSEWPSRFDAERALLEPPLGQWLTEGIHHIGSTAVPGLASKPIIDMMAGVRDLEAARMAFDALGELSYIYAPHRPGVAHHFSKPSLHLAETTYGLHLTEPESDLWRERLAFRDALCGDAERAAEYEALRLRLAGVHHDVASYTAGKRAFVARVLATAGIQLGRR